MLVAALDFGTTYSGYAFSFKGDYINDPSKINANTMWTTGSKKLFSQKTPTCLLLRPDKTFHSFGFEAEEHYSSLVEMNEHHSWYYFRRFKMLLHNNMVWKLFLWRILIICSITDYSYQSALFCKVNLNSFCTISVYTCTKPAKRNHSSAYIFFFVKVII